MDIDKADLTILTELQRDGRQSTVDLAKTIHLSPTPCANRIKRLQRDGLITGFHAHLSPAALGLNLLVFVQVKLRATDERTLDHFNRLMDDIPEVMECHMVGGGFDYLIKVRVRDMTHYRMFLAQVLGTQESIENTHSYFVMQEVKETAMLPINPALPAPEHGT